MLRITVKSAPPTRPTSSELPESGTISRKLLSPDGFKKIHRRPSWLGRPRPRFGEESHSLGVLLQIFRDKKLGFSYQISGSDISREMVSLCEDGHYKGKTIERFRELRLDAFNKFMRADGDGYRVIPDIRKRFGFFQHNLFDPLKEKDKFHLILLRNVLIYFKKSDQEKVVAQMHSHLATNGLLVIGESESLTNLETEFNPVAPLIYSKQAA